MKGYKLVHVRRNGTIGSLFINRRQIIPLNTWLQAEPHYTPGYSYRPGWHATSQPHAPHLSMKGRCWYEVEIKGVRRLRRPKSQGGIWWIAKHIKVIKPINKNNN